jgi:hypothetical protein
VSTPANIDPNKALELQLEALQSTAKTHVANIAAMGKQMTAKGVSDRQKAFLKSRIAMEETKLATTRKTAQAKLKQLYQNTGQYDKLLQGTERDAFAAVNALFKSYGLESLAPKIYDFVKNGYSADTISILLQDSKEYKQRFAGNEARIKAGLPVLSAGEYLSTEASYRQIMEQAGLPSGFYDSPSDFNNWIGGNVSPSEVQQRVDLATQATILANPNYKKALNAMGIADSELTAYFLDRDKSLPFIQKAAATAQIGAQALAQNLKFDQAYAETLATRGITGDQAAQGYAQIGAELDTLQDLAGIYGTEWNQREGEEAVFNAQSAAVKKRAGLASRERAQFQGSAGAGRQGLAGRGGAR